MLHFLVAFLYWSCFIISAFFIFLLFFVCLIDKKEINRIRTCTHLHPITIKENIEAKKKEMINEIIVCLLFIFGFLGLGISICPYFWRAKG
jgi:hypothetical protein